MMFIARRGKKTPQLDLAFVLVEIKNKIKHTHTHNTETDVTAV